MRSTLKAFAGLVLLLLTSACLVETEATIADPDPKAADARLVGTWYHAEKGEVILLMVAPDAKDDGVYRIVFANIRPGADEPVEASHYRAWRTVVNGRAYLSGERIGPGGKGMPAKTIIGYDIADGSLVLRLMDVKAAVDAIASGKLKGRVKKGGFVDEVTITSPRAELAAFVAGADRDGALFSVKTGMLRKMVDTAN